MPNRFHRAILVTRFFAVVLALGAGRFCPSLEPTTPLASYTRQAWVMENGLPQNTVQAMVQTRDGFLWLGTEVGLVRFDGSGFAVFDRNTRPALPGGDVRCLVEGRDGSLWIGTSDGLARWKDGTVTAFTTKDGLPANGIRVVLEDGVSVLWASTDGGWARLTGGRFVATSDNFLSDGLAANQFAASLANGKKAFANKTTVAIEPGGKGSVLRVGKELPGSKVQTLFADREGSLWIGTNRGLARVFAGKVQQFPVSDPLASASILTVLEDHEGNLWVGTEADGLHILRDQRFRTFGVREGFSLDATTTVVEGGAGKLWVGTSGGGLNALVRSGAEPGAVTTYVVRDALLSDVILSLATASNGDLWVGTPDGLNRIHGGAVDSLTSADGLPDDFIRSLLVDANGSLWIGTRRGLTHLTLSGGTGGSIHTGARMETFTEDSGLGSNLVGAMTRDRNGDLWVATFAGLSRLHDGKITNYTSANGLSSNVVTALLARGDGTLLIGTQDHGWNVWDGTKFSASMHDGLDRTTIHAILDDGSGHLWFATGNGIARCDCGGTGMGSQPVGCSHWIEFGPADGLRGRETATNSHPSAWRTHDGLLWFATPKGLVEADPAHFPVNNVAPPVAIERFAVDDVDQVVHAADSWLRIQAGHVHFQFDYAGLSFTAPQKVRYRYMLEGFDRKWTEAGARRTAYYTNIPPGRYTFKVLASNNDGVWSDAGAALIFELRPHFYQTTWFYALLLMAGAGGVFLLLRRRLRRAEREFTAVLGERNRIAREIHDTLAQGYVGISVQLEVLAELLRVHKVDAAARHLDTTRGYVREGLADARQSIWALRSQDSGEQTLPVRMRRLVEQAGGAGFESKFSIFGAYRPLPPGTERELLRVAQEAVQNVKKHAEAQNLFVQLEYGPAEIALEVRDDGRGFPSRDEPVSPPGHYGLTGMRERAAAIGGTLVVTSEPDKGTSVRLEAPAPRAAKEYS